MSEYEKYKKLKEEEEGEKGDECNHSYRPMRLRNSVSTRLGYGCMICGHFYDDDNAFASLK